MASSSVLNAVQHYQRSIQKSPDDLARLLHCVSKLYSLPITVEHLQETGVGRTVNDLRKYNGELGVAAEAVVNKWKKIVVEENDKRANNQSPQNEHHSSDENEYNEDNSNDDDHKDESEKKSLTTHDKNDTAMLDQSHNERHEKSGHRDKKDSSSKTSSTHSNHERHDRHKNEQKDRKKDHHSKREKHQKDDSKSRKHRTDEKESKTENSDYNKEQKEKSEQLRHKRSKDDSKVTNESPKTSRSDTKHEHSEKPSSSKDKEKHSENREKRHHSSSKHKHKDKNSDNNEKDKSKSKSNSETSNATTSNERKRRKEDEIDKVNSPKKIKSGSKNEPIQENNKQNNKTTEADEDGIDSSMGANFADVLGMLNMPKKKAKKSLGALKQTSPTSTKKIVTDESIKKTTPSKLNGLRDVDQPSCSTSVRNLEKKPDLLTSNVKLAPLDPSIVLDLPIISNNYKPLPLNPTVMDCVFNSATSSATRAPAPRFLSDAEALSHGISSKTMRTKVYSGVKSGQLLQVPSLFDLCIRVLQKNIDALEYTGGVPFDVLRPVIERATPQQLFVFEEYNPYLMEDSDELWKLHVERNYRGQKRQEMETWREMFMRCQEEQERRLSRLAENIKQSQKAIALPVRKTQLAFVDTMVKPPRNVMRKQEQFGTKSKLVATPAARVSALSSVTPNAAKTGDARLRVAAAVKYDPAQAAHAPMRPKKAPLMAKTLQFIRGRNRR